MNILEYMLSMAERFNRQITGIPIPNEPTVLSEDRVRSKHEMFIEEDDEFLEATTLEQQADALIDGIYFRLGALLEMGVLPGPIFDAVHDANMGKKRGTKASRPNSQGYDAVKPEGWVAPDLKPFLTITRGEADMLVRSRPLVCGGGNG